MSYGSDYFREAMTLNERNGNNKKRIIEKIMKMMKLMIYLEKPQIRLIS